MIVGCEIYKMFKFSPSRAAVLFFLSTLLLSTAAYTQEKTYWIIDTFKKVDGEPMRGATPDVIGDMLVNFRFIVKDGNKFHIDYPIKRDINTDTLKSLSYERFSKNGGGKNAGQLTDSIYDIGITDGQLQIKFNFEGTLVEDKRFVVLFNKLTEAEYKKIIAERFALVQEKNKAFEAFLKTYSVDPGWKQNNPITKRGYTISTSLGKENVSFPEDFYMVGDGSFYKNTFGKIQVGSLAQNNSGFALRPNNTASSISDAKFIMAKAPQKNFNLQQYLKEKPSYFKVIEQDENSFHAVELFYATNTKAVLVRRYISFKHVFKNGLHFFYISDDSNDDQEKESKEFAKQHYLIMRNITVMD